MRWVVVGNGEMFRQPYARFRMAANGLRRRQIARLIRISTKPAARITSSKLSKDLNCYNPDSTQYLDLYRAHADYNQIIGSLNPEQYQTCYRYAVSLNATKPFGSRDSSEHLPAVQVLKTIPSTSSRPISPTITPSGLGLYMPTTLHWKEKGVTIKAGLPVAGTAFSHQELRTEGQFHLKLRVCHTGQQRFLHPGGAARKWRRAISLAPM